MIMPALIDWNPIKLNYYPFVVTLDKCNGSCNALDDLSTKKCVPSITKDENVKVINIITRINEVKLLAKNISCSCMRIR